MKKVPEAHQQWVKGFQSFMRNLEDKAIHRGEYRQRSSEVFARFVDRFHSWVTPTWSGQSDFDKFKESDYRTFVKLLQEKSFIDAKYPLISGKKE